MNMGKNIEVEENPSTKRLE